MARLIQPENELEQLRALASDFQRLPDSMTDLLCHFSASAEKSETAEVLQHHEEELNDLLRMRCGKTAVRLPNFFSESMKKLRRYSESVLLIDRSAGKELKT